MLDDHSTDDTADIVRGLIDKHDNVRLVRGKQLPEGWVGKNYACDQLIEHARGEYVLVSDADTKHSRTAVSSALSCMLKNDLDALSAYPHMIMKLLCERMVVSFIKFGILMFVPLIIIKKTKIPFITTAIGSFMFYKKKVYKAIGGHSTVKGKCCEDVNMSRLVRKHGYRFMIFNGNRTYETRMYDNIKEVKDGVARYILTTVNYNSFAGLLIVLLLEAVQLGPFALIFIAPFLSFSSMAIYIGSIAVVALQVLIITLMKAIFVLKYEGRKVDIILHPLTMLYILVFAVQMGFNPKKALNINWKDRRYKFNNA